MTATGPFMVKVTDFARPTNCRTRLPISRAKWKVQPLQGVQQISRYDFPNTFLRKFSSFFEMVNNLNEEVAYEKAYCWKLRN